MVIVFNRAATGGVFGFLVAGTGVAGRAVGVRDASGGVAVGVFGGKGD